MRRVHRSFARRLLRAWLLRFAGRSELPLDGGGESAILSPHADDAAFSLGGLLQRDLIPRPITLITLFGRSNYCKQTGFRTDWRSNTVRRRAEDEAFARFHRLELRYLELPEASIRQQDRAVRRWRRPPASPWLGEALAAELSARPFRFVWIPLALGNHQDHVLTEQVATPLARAAGLTRLYYEDLPYAAAQSERQIRWRAAAVEGARRWTRVDIGGVLDSKLRALDPYESQVRDGDLAALRRHHSRWDPAPPAERVWWGT